MLDPRFADDPFVIDRPHGRVYVGIPLLGADRLSAIGTLSVVDTIPRKLHPSELQALSALARLVERRIAGRDHVADLGQTHGQLRTTQGSLERARGQLYDAIESVDAGVAMHDATGKLILSNRTYEALTSRVEMLCTSEVVAKDGGGEGSTAFAPGEHRLGDRWVRVSSRRTQEGALVSLLTDITSLKKTHDDLLVARNLA
jgi:PAS domain-containing protein